MYLEPFDRLLAGRAEDAVVKVADGGGPTGQGRKRGGGTHSSHCVGHCGEITPLIDSLPIVHNVLVIAQICQREKRCMEERGKTNKNRTEGRSERKLFGE